MSANPETQHFASVFASTDKKQKKRLQGAFALMADNEMLLCAGLGGSVRAGNKSADRTYYVITTARIYTGVSGIGEYLDKSNISGINTDNQRAMDILDGSGNNVMTLVFSQGLSYQFSRSEGELGTPVTPMTMRERSSTFEQLSNAAAALGYPV